jgi:hypothetical protein
MNTATAAAPGRAPEGPASGTKSQASTKPAPAPAPTDPEAAGAGRKRKKGVVDKANSRLVKTADWGRAFQKLLENAHEESVKGGPFEPLLARATSAVTELVARAVALSTVLLELHKAKWTPPKARPAGDWRVNDKVAMKPKPAKRYLAGDAFTKEQLAALVVVSVHGEQVKVGHDDPKEKTRIFVGLVPRRSLKAR